MDILGFLKNKQARIKEDLTIQDLIRNNTRGWATRFISDIYRETVMYPHEEMMRAIKSYSYNAYIYAAVETLKDFIIGGEIRIESKDKKTQDFLNKYLKQSELLASFGDIVRDLVITGNAYLERISIAPGLYKYKYINTPQRIFIDYDYDKERVKRYIQQVPESFMVKGVNSYTINYYGGQKKTLMGIEIPPEKILHLKIGKSLLPIYGRGAVAVIVNDIEISNEIDRSIAIISRYKAVPKKIISLKNAPPIAVDRFRDDLNNLQDYENPITNQEIDIKDLSSPVDIAPQIVDYIKRKLTVALAPEYIIHGEETNRATAKEQRIGFLLRIKAIRRSIAVMIEKELQGIVERHGLSNDYKLVFGEFDIGEKDEEINRTLNLWNNGLITLNEARTRIGLKKDSDYGDYYKWELVTNTVSTQNEQESTPGSNENQGAEKEKNINK